MGGQVVGYIRVSSAEQNIARQEESVGLVDRTFIDRASGKDRAERPQLKELLAWVRDGDHVRVSSMDRLARSVVDLHQVVDEITAKGASIEFIREGLTFGQGPQDPTSRLLLAVMGAVAAFERDIIRERQAEGISLAKKRGTYKGRARRLTPAQVDEARHQIDRGVPKAVVARDLGCSRQTLYTAIAEVRTA